MVRILITRFLYSINIEYTSRGFVSICCCRTIRNPNCNKTVSLSLCVCTVHIMQTYVLASRSHSLSPICRSCCMSIDTYNRSAFPVRPSAHLSLFSISLFITLVTFFIPCACYLYILKIAFSNSLVVCGHTALCTGSKTKFPFCRFSLIPWKLFLFASHIALNESQLTK